MANGPTNSDLNNQLGEIRGMAIAILRELDQSREDRKQRDENIDARFTHFDTSLNIAAKVAAQARDKATTLEDKFTALENTIDSDIKPQTDKLKNFGLKAIGFVAGLSLAGSFLATPVWAAIASAIKSITS